MEVNKIYNMDCLEGMKQMEDKSVDMILCDLPYGTTACEWDNCIDMEKLWVQYKRIIKDTGAIVLTAREPFTSHLVLDYNKMYRHKWVWNKKLTGNIALAKYMPLQIDEDVLVFSLKTPVVYNPIMRLGKMRRKKFVSQREQLSEGFGSKAGHNEFYNEYYPVNIIEFPNTDRASKTHPTQKPVALFEYLIKTYTIEGDLVLDNCIGSGTTALACLKTNRKFIGMELNKEYYDTACKRIEGWQQQTRLV